ncbi:MAG: DUF4232 domain-containing protein [Acidobacteriota bacterium]|nr:DUF4232 domain-containing protein [Acidobacteriota bacterium]
MKRRSVLLVWTGFCLLLVPSVFAQMERAPSCSASQLSLSTDSENGSFDGMSHSGTLLVLRNVGSTPCSVAGFPALTFLDSANKPLPISRETPRGMHPGPVVLPVTVVPGAELTASLRWISGDVVTHGSCFAASSLSVNVGAQKQEKLATRLGEGSGVPICGRSGGVTYTMTRLVPDPR